MAEPLSGIHQRTGKPYQRPPAVEAAIDAALAMPRAELIRRLGTTTRTAADYIRTEVILHLVRRSGRENGTSYQNALITALQKRLAMLLPRGSSRVDDHVREKVADEFVLRLAKDLEDGGSRLDFYECCFEGAITMRRRDARDQFLRTLGKTVALGTEEDEDGIAHHVEIAFQELLDGRRSDFDDPVFRSEVLGAISLLEPELRAVAVLMFPEAPNHTDKTTDMTIARALGISDRTVRKRRQDIILRLRRILVEGDPT